jgi:colanic acid/amylovoran biosynthesis glycosyltransferase
MKIAFLVGQFPALSQTFVLRQITGLIDRGHDVEIFAHRRGKDPVTHVDVEKYGLLDRTHYLDAAHAPLANRLDRIANRAAVLCANFHKHPGAVLSSLNLRKFGKKAISLQVFSQILPFLSSGPFDILHCHFGPNGNLGVILRDAAFLCKKVVTTFHGYDVSSYTRSNGQHIYRDLFARGDLFLCVSDRIQEKLISLGCREDRIVVHRCGIDTNELGSSPPERNRNGRLVVLTVGRLVEKKGVEDGIRAVAKLLKKYPSIEYKIVGDGPLKADLQNLIEKLDVGKNITLAGWKRQDEVVELLRQADVFLAPSVTSKSGDEEGIPVTLMEAAAQSLPVVSTYHAGIPEVVHDGESGFLVPERAPDALAEKLQRLVEQPNLRLIMGRNGRRFVEEHYDIDKLNDCLVTIFQELLNRGVPCLAPLLHVSPGLSSD